jgi:4-hydroxy-tetrahydrodipicolinate synthase
LAYSRYLYPMQLRGCGTALVTPFRQDGSIDDAALRNLVAWQVECGIDFLVPCGTTGETPTLSHDEWLHVIDTTIEVVAGRVPIVAGATSNSTHDAVEKAKEVAPRPGVNAILTASPYYNKPTQEGQYRHFRAIAEAIDKPIILYNVPGRTGANIEPATLLRLAEVPNILGVKEASGNITQIAEVCNAMPEHFLVFSGDDAITLPVIALGGVGIISVASNEIPREMAEMTRAALNNDWDAARRIHRKYLALMQANFIESNPLPVKAVLAMMGKIEEVYRLPLLPMRRDTRSKLQKIVTDAGLITKPAAPAAEVVDFYIYENWLAGPHKVVLHRSSCGQCNHGKGRPAGHDANHARWHGPYATLSEAREVSHTLPGVLIRSECKCI